MKLQNLISKVEKASGKKVEKNGHMFYLRVGDNSISFFENGIGSGNVIFVTMSDASAKEQDWRNAKCYDSYTHKIKGAVEFITGSIN